MKKVNLKKAGISMVALVITIIVLIILTSAIVINGIGAPKQAQLAVFYSNIDTVQDLVSLEMGNNMIEGAVRGYDDNYKWKGIVEGYGWDENNNVLLEPANAFNKTSEGIGENIEPIMSSLLDNTTLENGEKSKYYVGESGKVYYKGFEYEGKTYYNKDKRVEEINKPIEPVVVPQEPVEGTAAYIANHATEYYGEYVNYRQANGDAFKDENENDIEWRIFYADEENIYITTRRPVEEADLDTYYNVSNRNDAVAALLNHNNSKNLEYVNSTYAEWAQGGMTYEMLRDSYNAIVGPGAQNLAVDEETGEVIYASNSLSGASGTQADLYAWANNSSLGNGYNYYWMASPSADNSDNVMIVFCDYSIVYAINYSYAYGVRPLVCLKSNIQLIESGVVDANGYMTYNISTVTQ